MTSCIGPSRWIAAVPFGAGQFQNGDTALGVSFRAGEVALLSTAIASGLVLHKHMQAAQVDPNDPPEANSFNRKTEVTHGVMTALAWSFVGVAVPGVLEAQLSLKKPLDDGAGSVTYLPSVEVKPGAATLGVSGRF